MKTHLILYVADQERSKNFYRKILKTEPVLDVPGMTEFGLSVDCILGLMPENNIAGILSDKVPHPSSGNGIPRCELYLYVDNINKRYDEAKKDAILLSEIAKRSWGDTVCYFADPDGHILALAEKSPAI